jgi:hypothetical protein
MNFKCKYNTHYPLLALAVVLYGGGFEPYCTIAASPTPMTRHPDGRAGGLHHYFHFLKTHAIRRTFVRPFEFECVSLLKLARNATNASYSKYSLERARERAGGSQNSVSY